MDFNPLLEAKKWGLDTKFVFLFINFIYLSDITDI